MNRLSSFYQVSQHSMAGQEPPTFSAMPDVGMPKPEAGFDPGADPGAAPPVTAAGSPQVLPDRPATIAAGNDSRAGDSLPSHSGGADPVASPVPVAPTDRPVGTEIDSVGTLPPQTVNPAPGPPSPAPGPTAGAGEPVPPMGTGSRVPMVNGPVPRTAGPGMGPKAPLTAQGRTGATSPTRPVAGPGRVPSGPIGQTGPTAQGRAVSGPTATGQPPAGRGVTGGAARPTMPGPRPGLPGAGARRADGVVGGRPSAGPVTGSSGSRLPRGPVIGADSSGGSRAVSGAVGQRGVVGAAPHGATNNGQAPRRTAGNPDGVVGKPKEPASAAVGRRSGFTAGGSGLVRGPAGTPRRSNGDADEGVPRPDYLVEDDETHLPGNRRHVPPLID